MRNIRFFLLMALCTIGLTTFAQRQFNIYIDLNVSPTIEADNQQFYDVCIGDTITFIATEEFINNDNEIQDDSIQNLNFYWMMTKGDNLAYMWYDTIPLGRGRVFKYAFSRGGGYEVKCEAWSSSHICNSNDNAIRFRVSMAPNTYLTTSRQYICRDTEVYFEATEPTQETWTAARSGFVKQGQSYIGVGVQSSLIINELNNSTRIQTVDDIDHIYLNIEHSYFGDLEFMIECPSGKKCMLHAFLGSETQEVVSDQGLNWTNTGGVYLEGSKGGRYTHLGLAPDPSSNNDCYYTPGEGFTYNIYSNGTIPFGIDSPKELIVYTDPCGNIEYDSVVIPGLHYGPYESMESLIGCPLNGRWKLYVVDHALGDDGYLFEWGIFFGNGIQSINDEWSFTTTYDINTASWSGDGITNGEQGNLVSTAFVPATNEGPVPYTFSLTDNWGCTHETSIDVNVAFEARIPEIGTASINTENQVVVSWIPLEGYGTQAYYIYRERDSQWLLAEVVPASETNYWIDETVDPSEQSYRYRVTSVDECGESQMSDIRETLFLNISSDENDNWVLSWSHYEASSTDSCVIYRGFSPVSLEAIDTVAANLYSYTDTTATENTGYFYQIEIIHNTRSLVRQFSNIIDNGLVLPFIITAEPEADSLGSVTGGGEYYAFNKATLLAVPTEGYHFVSWDDGNTDNPRIVNVLCDSTFVALFAPGNPCFYINAYSLNPDMGTVTGSGIFEAGTTISLEAIPNDGNIFDSWSDGNQDNPREIVVTCDATYIALFAIESGNDKNLNSNIMLFPNPTSSLLNIVSSKIISSIEIISSAGKIISKIDVEKFNISLDVENLKAGIYLLRIIGTNNQDSQILRFAKE
ncbi:MAG: fibronectin type III domain-containing protein [Bacteroidales bacterium]|nr:fibronectin type III domain-containing protein [Bacteroidales bacterium]